MNLSSRTVTKIALPLVIAAGLGFAYAPVSQIADNPFTPSRAFAAASTQKTATASDCIKVSVGSFSVTFPEEFEASSSNDVRKDAVLGLYSKLDEENNTGTLAAIFTASDMKGTITDPIMAESTLAAIPMLFKVAGSDCTLVSDIYETRTDSGDYLYFSFAQDSKGKGGCVFLAVDDEGTPFMMFMNGVTDTDEATADYITQLVAVARSVTGGVQMKGLADDQLDIALLTKKENSSQDSAKEDISKILSELLD